MRPARGPAFVKSRHGRSDQVFAPAASRPHLALRL